MKRHGCVPIKFNLEKQAEGWIWPAGHILPSPVPEKLSVKGNIITILLMLAEMPTAPSVI